MDKDVFSHSEDEPTSNLNANTTNSENVKVRKWPKRVVITLLVVIVLCCADFFVYVSDYYHAGPVAESDMNEQMSLGLIQENDTQISVGSRDAQVGIILYPGAKVDPKAYVPLAEELADRGYYCAIVKMPFNLAFFGIDSANTVINSAPGVDLWWIAGHSLGGAMAAQYASNHTDALEGLFLLAAYSTTDLSGSSLTVNILYGSNDGVLNRDALNANAGNMPAESGTYVINGGNHAGFGDYGPQEDDGESSIGAAAQWKETALYMDGVIQEELTAA